MIMEISSIDLVQRVHVVIDMNRGVYECMVGTRPQNRGQFEVDDETRLLILR